MALEFMHNEMIRQLNKISAPQETIDKYDGVWAAAMRNNALPIPCPPCFIAGNVSRLSPLRDDRGISSARCDHCRTKFEWRSPE